MRDPEQKRAPESEAAKSEGKSTPPVPDKAVVHSISLAERRGFSSMVMPVKLYTSSNSDNWVETYALVDTQANTCFVRADIANTLNVPQDPVQLEIITMGAATVADSTLVEGLTVCGLGRDQEVSLPPCYTRPMIPADPAGIPRAEDLRRYEHLRELADEIERHNPEMDVGLLLGVTCPDLFLQHSSIVGGPGEPFAVETVLGWSVFGQVGSVQSGTGHLCNRTLTREITTDQIRSAFDIGFEDSESEEKMSAYDRKFMTIMEEGMSILENGRVELPLPFKEEPSNLPNSRVVALKRLLYLKRRLSRFPDEYRQYCEFMNKLFANGHAERVPENEVDLAEVFYLAHQGVKHPRKPGEIRVVHDPSTEVCGVSLNSLLLPGPDMLNNLTGVLMNFRLGSVALICDIRSMFFQVSMTPRYRNFVRFLWFKDGDLNGPVVEYRMTVHAFGLTSSPACANFALRVTANRNEELYGWEAANFVRKRFYVDDGLAAVSSESKAAELAEQSQKLCAAGSFDLRKFSSNKQAVLNKISPDKLADDVKKWTGDKSLGAVGCTLGMGWDRVKDSFVYHQELKMKRMTRRHMLSSLSSIFDPMGLIGPCLLPGRLILQELCGLKLHWDEEVSAGVASRWTEWYSELENLRELYIKRCVFATVNEEEHYAFELHAISDASTQGYGACIYLVIRQGALVDSALIYAKSKVGPTKNVQIPRMELQAAVLAVQMILFVQQQLELKDVSVYYWTDSKIVLGYIANLWRKFHLFVANRVYFIQQHTRVSDWRYISTEENPADLASRGCTVVELMESATWFPGPPVIREALGADVDAEIYAAFLPESDHEIKRTVVAHQVATKLQGELLEPMYARQDWFFGVRVAAWVLRFVYNLVGTVKQRAPAYRPLRDSGLSVAEIVNAETRFITDLQKHAYPDVYQALSKLDMEPQSTRWARERNRSLRKHSNLYKLDVYLSGDGTMRVGGRVRRGNLPIEAAHPRLLPKNYWSEPLTPSRILTLKTMSVMPPPGVFGKTDLYCRERWRASQYLAEQFWHQWRREFLPLLQKRDKWQLDKRNLRVGDVVLVLDQEERRGKWPLGLVVKVKVSLDGLVRSATVKTQKGTYDRPVQKLSMLLRVEERPGSRQGATLL